MCQALNSTYNDALETWSYSISNPLGIIVDDYKRLLLGLPDNIDLRVPHGHSYYFIYYADADGGTFIVDNISYQIKRNTLLLIPPGVVLQVVNDNDLSGHVVLFTKNFISFIGNHIFDMIDNIFSGIDCRGGVFHIQDKSSVQILPQIRNMVRLNNSLEPVRYKQEVLGCSLASLMMTILQLRESKNVDYSCCLSHDHSVCARFSRLVSSHYREHKNINEYATMMGVSPKTLFRSVKLGLGTTPHLFIIDRLTNEAKRLLNYTDMPLKEIALFLGFDEMSNFFHFFKLYEGFTPNEYRKRK